MVINYIGQFVRGNVLVRTFSIFNIIIVMPLLIRTLGVEDFGYYNYLISIVVNVAIAFSLGMSEYSVLYVPTQDTQQKSATIFYTLLGVRLLYLPVFLIISYIVLSHDIFRLKVEPQYLYWIMFSSVFISMHGFLEIINRFLKFNTYYNIRLGFVFANSMAMGYVILSKNTIDVLFPLICITNALYTIAIMWFLRGLLKPIKIDFSMLRNIYQKCIFLFFNTSILYLMGFISFFFLLHYQGKYELGLYTIVVTICIGFATFVLQPVKDFMTSLLTLGFRENDMDLKAKAIKSYMIVFPVLVMPFILGYAVYGLPFTLLYGGGQFEQSHQYAIWVGLATFMSMFAYFFSDAILMHDDKNNKFIFIINVLILAINVGLHWALIQRLGTIGVAYATFISMMGGACIIMILSYYKGIFNFNIMPYLSPWLVLGVVYGFGHLFWHNEYGMLGTLVFSAVSWGAVIALSLLFSAPRDLFKWFYSRLRDKMAKD